MGGEPARFHADTIFHSGRVVTLDQDSTIASAVAVTGDLIVAVGSDAMLELYDAGEYVDLEGRTLLPGFVGSHTHFGGRFVYERKTQ